MGRQRVPGPPHQHQSASIFGASAGYVCSAQRCHQFLVAPPLNYPTVPEKCATRWRWPFTAGRTTNTCGCRIVTTWMLGRATDGVSICHEWWPHLKHPHVSQGFTLVHKDSHISWRFNGKSLAHQSLSCNSNQDTSPHRNVWDRSLPALRLAQRSHKGESGLMLFPAFLARPCLTTGAGSASALSRCPSCGMAPPQLEAPCVHAQALLRPGTTVALWRLSLKQLMPQTAPESGRFAAQEPAPPPLHAHACARPHRWIGQDRASRYRSTVNQ